MVAILESRHCALCGPNEARKSKYPSTLRKEGIDQNFFSTRRLEEKVHLDLKECGRCGTIFPDPALAVGELERLYQESENDFGDLDAQIQDTYSGILDQSLSITSQRKLFVEVGGGNGFMLNYAIDRGFEQAIEVEPSETAQKRFVSDHPQKKFYCEMFNSNTFKPDTVDLFCFFQVLDHISDPTQFLRQVYQCLRPGGVAVCVVHNAKAWTVRLLGERCSIFHICHNYLFNPFSLRSIFEKTGFEVSNVFSVANCYPISYWTYLLPIPAPVDKLAGSFLRLTGIGKQKVKLRAGNIAVIAQKPLGEGLH